MTTPLPRTPRSASSAFSLVEIIAVMAVISVLLGLVLPAVTGFGRSNALTAGGNLVANLASLARQRALTSGSMTALVMLGRHSVTTGAQNPTDTPDFRAFAVVEYQTDIGWVPMGKWEILPVGIVADLPTEYLEGQKLGSFYAYTPRPFPALSDTPAAGAKLMYQGQEVRDYAARVFLPSGILQNPEQPAVIQLVEGFYQNGQIQYTRRDASGAPTNVYEIALVGSTGTIKINRTSSNAR